MGDYLKCSLNNYIETENQLYHGPRIDKYIFPVVTNTVEMILSVKGNWSKYPMCDLQTQPIAHNVATARIWNIELKVSRPNAQLISGFEPLALSPSKVGYLHIWFGILWYWKREQGLK